MVDDGIIIAATGDSSTPEHQARRVSSRDPSIDRTPSRTPKPNKHPGLVIFACTKIDDVISVNFHRLPLTCPWIYRVLSSRHWSIVLSQSHIANQPPQSGSNGTGRLMKNGFTKVMKA